MSIKVLTVEDSVFIRKVLNDVIEEMDGVELVGTARNGAAALREIEALNPDLITLDVEMPVMDGIETLRRLREYSDIPVIMLSSRNDEETTIKALEMGAQDFLEKPVNIQETKEAFQKELKARMIVLTQADTKKEPIRLKKTATGARPKRIDALVIGASTGGPKALVQVIRSLPEKVGVPIFIVQHMPEGFTASFAKRLDAVSSVPVVEAADGMPIEKGTVYVARGGKHMVVSGSHIHLMDDKKIHGVKPAVDPLFETAGSRYKGNIAAVVLTGMGRDGTAGVKHIRKQGGYVLAQNEETSIVFGMPKYAIESGAVHEVMSLGEIAESIKEMVKV